MDKYFQQLYSDYKTICNNKYTKETYIKIMNIINKRLDDIQNNTNFIRNCHFSYPISISLENKDLFDNDDNSIKCVKMLPLMIYITRKIKNYGYIGTYSQYTSSFSIPCMKHDGNDKGTWKIEINSKYFSNITDDNHEYISKSIGKNPDVYLYGYNKLYEFFHIDDMFKIKKYYIDLNNNENNNWNRNAVNIAICSDNSAYDVSEKIDKKTSMWSHKPIFELVLSHFNISVDEIIKSIKN